MAGAPSAAAVACECAYWGGWDLFAQDTRAPLADTLDVLVGDGGIGILVFEVRDWSREASLLGMILERGLEVHREEPRDRDPAEGEVGVWSLRRLRGALGRGRGPRARATDSCPPDAAGPGEAP
ncbi:unnamed protein product, partial [Prorocentrum cordatum]